MGENVIAYSFEKTGSDPAHRHITDCSPDFQALVQRLGLAKDAEVSSSPDQSSAVSDELKTALINFVTQHHANIKWYQSKIWRELSLRYLYFVLSLVLLAVIPIAIYVLSLDKAPAFVQSILPFTRSANDANTLVNGSNASAITAALSGLIAFHRGVTAWLDKRQLVALYSKTRAQLKTAVYTFEHDWGPSHRDAAYTELALINALNDAAEAALTIVSAEQDAHYEIEAAPTFGLDDLLSAATSKAGTLTTALSYKQSQLEKDRDQAARTVRELQGQIEQYSKLLTQKYAILPPTPGTNTEINDLVTRRRSAEIDLALNMAKLNSLRADLSSLGT